MGNRVSILNLKGSHRHRNRHRHPNRHCHRHHHHNPVVGISPQQRRERIQESAQVLHRHLFSDQPLVLPPDIRWCIAEEARHCWMKCKVCATYSSSNFRTEQAECQSSKKHNQYTSQTRNGGKLFEDLRHAGHSFSDQLPFKVTGQQSWPRIRNIGKSILDRLWSLGLHRHTSHLIHDTWPFVVFALQFMPSYTTNHN